jgi:hypothetical protein
MCIPLPLSFQPFPTVCNDIGPFAIPRGINEVLVSAEDIGQVVEDGPVGLCSGDHTIVHPRSSI